MAKRRRVKKSVRARGGVVSSYLRKRIADSGLPLQTIADASGVCGPSLYRFLKKGSSLRLDVADRLCEYFNLSVVPQVQMPFSKQKWERVARKSKIHCETMVAAQHGLKGRGGK